MSRSFGVSSLTTRPPIETVAVGDRPRARRPCAARSSCRSRTARRARGTRRPRSSSDRSFTAWNAVVVDLVDLVEAPPQPWRSSALIAVSRRGTRARRRAGRPLAASTPRLAAVERSRARSSRARRAAGARRRSPRAPRGRAAARRASRAGRRSRRRRRARSGCRRGRAPRSTGGARSARGTPRAARRSQRLGPVPGHRAPRVLAPVALEPELVAREHHRHAGRRHLQPDADERGARASRATVRKRAVSWLSSRSS